MNDFREKVAALLNKNNMTQRELAYRVGITEVSLSRYISGDRIPKGPIISSIANVLHTTTDYLLNSESNKNESYGIDRSIISKSIEYYGEEIQSTVCMEECSELIQAISKMKRSEADKENLTEEIADVLVCIETLKQLYSVENSAINNWIRQKQQRQLRRMKNE